MAVHSALGLVIMGSALNVLAADEVQFSSIHNYEKKILIVTFLVVLVTGVGISLLSFNIMQKRAVLALHVDLSTRAEDQSEFIYQIIVHRSERSKVLSKNPDVLSAAFLLSRFPRDNRVNQEINDLKTQFKPYGFDDIALNLPSKTKLTSQYLSQKDAFFVALNGQYKSELLWNNGYFLIS